MDNAVKKFFGKKRKHMLATKIPDNPVERQKKETQYIAVRVREELSKIVGSKNVKTSSGGVTHYLRNHWGITDIFKKLLKERFLRFYELKADSEYKKISHENGLSVMDYFQNLAKMNLSENQVNEILKTIESIPKPLSRDEFKKIYLKCHIFYKDNNFIIKGYTKRVDHRHHAMDALVVACTNEKAVKRLNDLNKHLQQWVKEKTENGELNLLLDSDNILEDFLSQESKIRDKAMSEIEKFRDIKLPWSGFHEDARIALEQTVTSHKPKDKLLVQFKEEKNEGGKLTKTNEKTLRIRGALHEETIYGLSSGMESYRIPLSKFAGNQFDTEGNIEKIVNKFLRETIFDHFVNTYSKNKTEAFGAEGLLGLNKRLTERKIKMGGIEVAKPHPPIRSVKVYRKKIKKGQKYEITLQKLDREKSFNKNLLVNTGSNYLFAVLEKEDKRIYDIISLFDAVVLIKENFKNSNDRNSFDKEQIFKEYFENNKNAKLTFTLKQLDMVYLPDEKDEMIWERESPLFQEYWQSPERLKNIYTVTKFSGSEIYFIHHTIADVIEKKFEFGSQNMIQTLDGRRIVEFCFPIKLDRLGNIESITSPVGRTIKIENN